MTENTISPAMENAAAWCRLELKDARTAHNILGNSEESFNVWKKKIQDAEHACNNHDNILHVLKTAKLTVDTGCPITHDTETYRMICSAIAQAEQVTA